MANLNTGWMDVETEKCKRCGAKATVGIETVEPATGENICTEYFCKRCLDHEVALRGYPDGPSCSLH